MALFLVAAFGLVRSLKAAERDLLTGLALTLAFYVVVGGEGSHAHGYEQAVPVLGSAALLAASATVTIGGQRGGVLVPRLVLVSSAVAFLIQLPLRSLQAERSARPHAAPVATAAATAQPAPPARKPVARKPARTRR
jgi:hypothetical protein